MYILSGPTKCENEDCPSTNFTPVKTIECVNYKDYQEIKMQVRSLWKNDSASQSRVDFIPLLKTMLKWSCVLGS